MTRPENSDLTCAECGQPMWRSTSSAPQGLATCRPCRAERRGQCLPPPRSRRVRKGRTTERGYGVEHQRRRTALLASLEEGSPCPRCDQPMHSDQRLDLDHNDEDRTTYLGLSHSTCNRNSKRGIPQVVSGCPICGVSFKHRWNTRTCSRACGVEWKRRAA